MTFLERLNQASAADFVALLDGTYEHSPWIAERAAAQRPLKTLAALKAALARVVREATVDEQLGLIRAHPELAGKAAVAGELTAESTNEQQRAGLTACTPDEFAKIQQLNADYNARFGWPFILAVRGPRGTGLSKQEIITTFERRLRAHPELERAECLRQIHRIAEIRLNDKFGVEPRLGQQLWDWAAQLAVHSEHAEWLTCTYATPTHTAVADQLMAWMRDCGFDEVSRDAVGNVVGIYHGTGDQRLLTGSHYDTVRRAGRFDGRLGLFVPMLAVRELHQAGRRLPFGIEVVGFSEEEGQRFPATFLAASALIGGFDPAWLDQTDAAGITLRDAMQAAGLAGTTEAMASCTRDPSRYLGFVEVHIEQGPVLDSLDLPLGIVTSINGSRRYTGEVFGLASHAGTTPMGQRRDAAVGVAELILFCEQRASAVPDVVATVGMLEVPSGSINVIPGRCRFSLDLRATTDEARDALDADVRAKLDEICERRGLSVALQPTMAASAAPSDAAWQARWEAAVTELGLPLHRLPSGAGHDAMKLHERMPQAMLFVRGGNGGISHNPLESVTVDDAELAVAAFANLLEARGAKAELELVTVLPEHRQAYRQGREHLANRLNAQLPQAWPQFPEFFENADMPDLDAQWPACFFIDRRIGALVGNGGFTGAPDAEGCVEIGYEIAPAYRARGYATQAAQALINIARERPGVVAVKAHTLAELNASNAVLRKLGMRFIAEQPNEEVGKVWLWRLDLQSKTSP